MRIPRLEFYKSTVMSGSGYREEWRWRVKAGNNKVIGASSEGFKAKQKARANAKQLAAVIASLLALTGCETLAHPPEAAWQALHIVDMVQTADGMRDSCVREGHPVTSLVIGSKPSTHGIVAYGIASAGVHLLISNQLQERGMHRAYAIWQTISLVDTGYAVHQNHAIGIRIGKPNKTGCNP